MLKTVAVLVGGIFVGAIAMEIIHMECPGKLQRFYGKLGSLSSGVKEGFLEGYHSTARRATPAGA
jgi:hypothetical protein